MQSKKGSSDDIKRLRSEIDEIDLAILQLIAKRKSVALEIAKVKQKTGPKEDDARIREILDRITLKGKELGLDEKEVGEIWKAMIAYMIKEQMKKHPY